MSSLIMFATAFVLVLIVLRRLFSLKHPEPFPPGPRGLPLLGSLLDMPSKESWLTFFQWGEIWGDITYIRVLGHPIIILNSAQVAVNLLDKRSAIYSDRRVVQMAGKLIGYDKMLGILPYGDRFRRHRRVYQQVAGTRALVAKFLPIQEEEMHQLLRRVLDTPDYISSHISQMAGSIAIRISHGYKPQAQNDPLISLGRVGMSQFSRAATPGAFLVDDLPFLQHLPDWFPGTGFKKFAKQCAGILQNWVNQPHEYLKQQLKSGTANVSFAAKLLQRDNLSPAEEDDIKWTAASIFGGGVETTTTMVEAFYLAMSLYPEVQKRAQAEIDTVVGNNRLPSFADRSQLPYIEAVSMELLRWHTAVPTGIPHRLIIDDIYEGYLIPKGTTVIPNIWGMLRDPRDYPDPMTFDPSRFIATDGVQPQRDPRELCFGFGRRACPGKLLADSSLFICCAMNLAVFNIRKRVEDGIVVEPVVRQLSGVVSFPTPYKCTVVARSEQAISLIRGT